MEKNSTLNYNYIICGAGGYYDVGYRDIMHLDCVNYFHAYDSGINNVFLKKMIRLNFSKRINKYIKTPFARLVYPYIYKPKFKDLKPLCFIFFGNIEYVYQTSFIKYLRDRYPNTKVILYMQDLISKNSRLDFESVRTSFDLIISYDKGDCAKYNLYFHPTPMSRVNVEKNLGIEDSDIYFCGYAKTRYPLIHKIYKQLSELGLKCDFHIMKFPEGEEKLEGIYYESNDFTYEENIQHVISTKCVLEVMQEGADGYTPRVWESVIYDKHLLTNNISLKTSEYYNSDYMHFIDEETDLSSIIHREVSYKEYEKDRLSPFHLLCFIDNLLLNL